MRDILAVCSVAQATLTLFRPSVIKISSRYRMVLRYAARLFRSSSMAEHPAVNRRVVSSSLTCGANIFEPNGQPNALPVFSSPSSAKTQTAAKTLAIDLEPCLRSQLSVLGLRVGKPAR